MIRGRNKARAYPPIPIVKARSVQSRPSANGISRARYEPGPFRTSWEWPCAAASKPPSSCDSNPSCVCPPEVMIRVKTKRLIWIWTWLVDATKVFAIILGGAFCRTWIWDNTNCGVESQPTTWHMLPVNLNSCVHWRRTMMLARPANPLCYWSSDQNVFMLEKRLEMLLRIHVFTC